MGKIILPGIDLAAQANPAAGKYILGFDQAGNLSKKDSAGVVSAIGAGGDFIATTGGALETGAIIGSANASVGPTGTASGYLSLDYNGQAGKVMLSVDAGAYTNGQFYAEPGYVEVSTYAEGGTAFFTTTNKGFYITDNGISQNPAVIYSIDSNIRITTGSQFSLNGTRADFTIGGFGAGNYEVISNAVVGAATISVADGTNTASMNIFASGVNPGDQPIIAFLVSNGMALQSGTANLRMKADTGMVSMFFGIEDFANGITSINPNNRTLHTSTGAAIVNYSSDSEGLTYASDLSAGYSNRSLVDKEYVDTKITTLKVSVSAAQIRSGFTTPVSLIGSPGPGKAMSIISALARFNFGTTGFDAGTLGRLALTGADNAMFELPINGTVSTFQSMDRSVVSGNITIVEDANIEFRTDADSTLGDSTIDFYITYSIITL